MTVPIWLRPERASRGPRPAHRRADLAAAAIRVADAEGVEAVSLRRVAADLGAGTASLYRYIASKDELFELMVDETLGEHAPPAPCGDWRADLRAIADGHRAMALRHPWLATLPPHRPVFGPNSLAWLEATFATVRDLGFDPDETLAQVGTVLTFVRGHVVEELAEREARRRSGLDMPAWLAEQERYGALVIGDGRYPQLSRIMLEARGPHDPERFERAYRRGLEHIIAGIAAAASPVGSPPGG